MIEKSYIYRVYRDSNYLGLIYPTSEFGFNQDINTAGSSITISVPLNMDNASEAIDPILDEDGNIVLDESDNPLLSERQPDEIGNSNDAILLRNGNTVEITEVSNYHPNGKSMFSGQINLISGDISGENFEETVDITVYSFGFELDNYIIQDGA